MSQKEGVYVVDHVSLYFKYFFASFVFFVANKKKISHRIRRMHKRNEDPY
jgi:hypothetical protein